MDLGLLQPGDTHSSLAHSFNSTSSLLMGTAPVLEGLHCLGTSIGSPRESLPVMPAWSRVTFPQEQVMPVHQESMG